MLIEKTGTLEYRIQRQPDGGVSRVHPREELTPQQYRMLCTQPDMIVQCARHLADRAGGSSSGSVQFFADSYISFNGRPSQRYVNPTVNLADPNLELEQAIEALQTPSTRYFRGGNRLQ